MRKSPKVRRVRAWKPNRTEAVARNVWSCDEEPVAECCSDCREQSVQDESVSASEPPIVCHIGRPNPKEFLPGHYEYLDQHCGPTAPPVLRYGHAGTHSAEGSHSQRSVNWKKLRIKKFVLISKSV